jgi:hypothetical protein
MKNESLATGRSLPAPPRLPPRALAALAAVAARLDAAGVEWLLAGSAGRALAGFRVRPGDLDIEATAAHARAAARALGLSIAHVSGAGRASWRAVGIVAGIGVDLSGDLSVDGPGGRLAPDLALQRAWASPATVAGRTVWVAPVEEAVARALVAADWALLGRLAREAAGGPPPALRPAYVALRCSAAASAAR